MTHKCTGCPTCDGEMRAALRAFSAGDYPTYCRWLTKRNEKLRVNSARGELRTNVHFLEDTIMENDYTPIDPYAPGIALLRAAAATPESQFAERYAAQRLAALAAEDAEVAQLRTAHEARQTTPPKPRVLTAAELQACEPPNGYQIALDRMRSAGR